MGVLPKSPLASLEHDESWQHSEAGAAARSTERGSSVKTVAPQLRVGYPIRLRTATKEILACMSGSLRPPMAYEAV